MDIAIIGGAGQLGRCVYDALKTNFNTVSFTKNSLSVDNYEQLNDLISPHSPKYIINCSAYTKVELAESEKTSANSVNFIGVKNLCRFCTEVDATLIHFSTDYIYDGVKELPYSESDAPNPINEYGASKLKGDIYIAKNLKKYFIFRVSGIFSKYGENFVKTMLKLRNKDNLSIISDQIMKPSSAKFIADFLKINLQKNNFTRMNAGEYNLASEGPELSWYEFSEIIFNSLVDQSLASNVPKLIPISSSEYHGKVDRPKYSALSNAKVKKKFIIRNSDYRKNLLEEMKEIFQTI